MKEDTFLGRMKVFVFEAGRVALDSIGNSEPALKSDNSVVTKADQTISRLAREELSDLLQTSKHILIDEEDKDKAHYLDPALLKKADYLWLVDPIDGTRNYANRMPNFAVSIGVLKELKPWLGAVYFPALNELFYCDGERAFFVQDAFTAEESIHPIKPVDQNITSHSLFLTVDKFLNDFEWDFKDCRLMIQACAAIDMCWPSIGRGCGSILNCALWDFAGAWPIAIKAGLDLRSLTTGKVLDSLDLDVFDKETSPWRLKDCHILSSKRNFSILKNKITKIK